MDGAGGLGGFGGVVGGEHPVPEEEEEFVGGLGEDVSCQLADRPTAPVGTHSPAPPTKVLGLSCEPVGSGLSPAADSSGNFLVPKS